MCASVTAGFWQGEPRQETWAYEGSPCRSYRLRTPLCGPPTSGLSYPFWPWIVKADLLVNVIFILPSTLIFYVLIVFLASLSTVKTAHRTCREDSTGSIGTCISAIRGPSRTCLSAPSAVERGKRYSQTSVQKYLR